MIQSRQEVFEVFSEAKARDPGRVAPSIKTHCEVSHILVLAILRYESPLLPKVVEILTVQPILLTLGAAFIVLFNLHVGRKLPKRSLTNLLRSMRGACFQ